MKRFAIFFILSLLDLLRYDSFTTISKTINQNSQVVNGCDSNEINAFYNSIAKCQVFNITETANCMGKFVEQTLHRKWNVFTKSSNSPANVSTWWTFNNFDNCLITLNNYGKFNRTYQFWPAQFKNQKSLQRQIFLDDISLSDPEECNGIGQYDVQDSIKNCQNTSYDQTTLCIRNDLYKKKKFPLWSIYATNNINESSIFVYPTLGTFCVKLQHYGQYNRTYIAWDL